MPMVLVRIIKGLGDSFSTPLCILLAASSAAHYTICTMNAVLHIAHVVCKIHLAHCSSERTQTGQNMQLPHFLL